ncbi:MAG: FxsA family protein [Hyphomicrobiaceae bacterium]
MNNPIRAIFLLIFIAIPLIEIALLIKIGQAIGFWATISLVIGTAVFGTWLLHSQGMQTLNRVLSSVNDGKPPVAPVLEGFVLLVAGLLLLTPGILTDTVGFILLVPPIRQFLVRHALARVFVTTVGGGSPHGNWRTGGRSGQQEWTDAEFEDVTRPGEGHPNGGPTQDQGPIIEGEYERLDERSVDPKRGKS